MKKQVEMSIQDENGNEFVAYPKTYKDHVQFDNGMTIDEYLEQDVAMPTVTHEESSIKVGVGDSDVSSSVVDSAVNMTIKGQTYQNILPEPTLRNEMQGKSMQRLNEGYDNIEVVDGVSKSAILKGCTGYRDIDTGEILETFEEGRNLELVSVKMPDLKTTGKNMFDGELELGTIAASDGYLSETTLRARSSNYIPVFASKTYTLINYDDSVLRAYYEYDKNKQFLRQVLSTGKTSTFTVSSDTKYIKIVIAKPDDTTINSLHQKVGIYSGDDTSLSYEPYKTNILHTPEEVVLRSLPNGVCDTLNCMTGEYVQRIKEVVFDGSSDESIGMVNINDTTLVRFNINNVAGVQTGNANKVLCSSLPYLYIHGLSGGSATVSQECISNHSQDANVINIVIKRSRLSSVDVAGFRAYLQSNPITIQYSIATPVVKTVDLSSHGNWEKVVLDGDENWQHESGFAHNNLIEFKLTIGNGGMISVISDRFATGGSDVERIACNAHRIYIRILKSKVNNLDEFKQWLQQNPTTVWCQTTTTQDNSIREMLSFANGHLQVSSEAENSLLPTVQYEIPTKNSYHMDLMKTNTLYTMKAKSVSGTFTIDGTSYNVDANGTFTSPSSMTDKLLIMSNKTNEEVMVLEGNVVDKTIPYFKGIKSAFEGEDKIEVLSTGKNLFDIDKYALDNNLTRVGEDGLYINRVSTNLGTVDIQYKKKTQYVVGYQTYELLTTNDNWTPTIQFKYSDGTQEQLYLHTGNRKVSNVNKDVVEINIQNPWANVTANVYGIYVEEFPSDTTYEPHKSNTTKIPLLSPLGSLPNGVCDELIIDRLNHKAKLVQRVGKAVFDGSSDEVMWFNTGWTNGDCVACYWDVSRMSLPNKKFGTTNMVCDKFPTVRASIVANGGIVTGEGIWGEDGSSVMYISLNKTKLTELSVNGFRQWASQNPFTVLYELKTPIITEIDLEGYPYAYKDGHIFLNSDIAPTTQITYSINQAQQIESANESLQRHEKEISHLQKLIAQYIQVEYESTLLSLKI